MKQRAIQAVLATCLSVGGGMWGWNCEAQSQDQPNAQTDESAATGKSDSLDKTQSRKAAKSQPRGSEWTSTDSESGLAIPLAKNLWGDQKAIWASPLHLHWDDASWFLPFAEATAGMVATDRAVVRALPGNSGTQGRFRSFSDAGAASFVAAGGGMYLVGRVMHNDHKRETGILTLEAITDSLAVNSALKYSFGRERPYQDQGRGSLFQVGTSFPSDHAAVAWSAASVIAHEYPGTLTQVLVYGAATAVDLSRVTGREHFPSDVVIGSGMAWLIGREVYKRHHDPEVGGGGWESLSGSDKGEETRDPLKMGSPFVPLDSWVYPALDRLAALGYIRTSMSGMKPWTRLECARLTEEVAEGMQSGESRNDGSVQLEMRLREEFAYEFGLLEGAENLTASVESVYTRAVSISGPDLTDGYHFGQTIAYDFGRPFERGLNLQEGGSFSASAGPMTLYVRAEFQHAPAAPAPPTAVINTIALRDAIPAPPDAPFAEINRPEFLDAYLGVNLGNWELLIGRQSLEWGPGVGGALLWNNNIQPVDMARIVSQQPFELPSFLHYLGPMRVDQFFGRLEGHSFIRRPFILGQKISFKPIRSLELGFGRTYEIGGEGQPSIETPFTAKNFLYGFFGQIPSGQTGVPGHNESEFDWTYYVPKTGDYIVFYGDMNAADDFLPFQNPPKNPYRPGIYITHFPKIPRLDFHMEAADTESPGLDNPGLTSLEGSPTNHGDLNYWNGEYRDGETYNGFLIGNTVGRDGRAIQMWLTYWLSPRNTLRFNYKHSSVSPDFIPGGGLWQDYSVSNEMYLRSGFYVKSQVQFEHIARYPILLNGARNNVAAILEIGFLPHKGEKSKSSETTRR
jgi:membrane-associated phospholipid phosphatase